MSEEKSKKLTPKQEAWAWAYLETGNASEAYRRAYPGSEKWKAEALHVKASEMLAKGNVQVWLDEQRRLTASRNEITIDKIVRELALIGFSNMLDYMTISSDGQAFVDLSKLTRDQAAAIGEITSETYTEGRGEDAEQVKRTKFKLSDKRAALVDLGKHLGMFPQQINGTIDHKHHHSAEPISASAEWLEGLLGAGQASKGQKSLPH